jgi:hypothetical protein
MFNYIMNRVERLAYKVNKGYLTTSEFIELWNNLDDVEKRMFLNVMKKHRKSVVLIYGNMFLYLLFNKTMRFVFL